MKTPHTNQTEHFLLNKSAMDALIRALFYALFKLIGVGGELKERKKKGALG